MHWTKASGISNHAQLSSVIFITTITHLKLEHPETGNSMGLLTTKKAEAVAFNPCSTSVTWLQSLPEPAAAHTDAEQCGGTYVLSSNRYGRHAAGF